MRNVFIYATCQGSAIGQILQDNASFNEQFNLFEVARNYVHIQENRPLIDDAYRMQCIKDCDVFIYQPLDDFYGRHSTNNIFPFLKPSCIRISMPYVTNTSLWPIFKAHKRDIGTDWVNGNKEVTHNTYPLNKLLNEGRNTAEILSLFDNNDIDWMFKERHAIEMELLKHKESDTTIKVHDYIEQNLSSKRMFAFFSHLSADLFVHMANQICSIIDIEEQKCNYDENHFFPSVAMSMMPTCSVEYFKMSFVSKEEMTSADRHYRNIITQYLNEKRK